MKPTFTAFSLILLLFTAASCSRKPQGSEYFAPHENKRVTYAVKMTARGLGTVEGAAISRGDGTTDIGGKRYYKSVTTIEGILGASSETSYSHLGNDGIYTRKSTDANAPETLDLPLPPNVGRKWTYRSDDLDLDMEIAAVETLDTAEKSYAQCLKLVGKGTKGKDAVSVVFHMAPKIGLVKSTMTAPGFAMEMTLNSNAARPSGMQYPIARDTPPPPPPIPPVEREANDYIQKLAETYWLKDGAFWLTRFEITKRLDDVLYLETKALEYRYTSNQATAADQLNGIEWKGEAVFTLVPTRSYSPRGTIMHWTQHPAGWTLWKDQPFMNPGFKITKVNGQWSATPLEPAPMTKPGLLEVHKITGRMTAEERAQLDAVPKRIIGTWREKAGTVTYLEDGTGAGKYDGGHTAKMMWHFDDEVLVVTELDYDGKQLSRPNVFRYKVLELTDSTLRTKRLPKGDEFHAIRAK
jgi:hypothetical protein